VGRVVAEHDVVDVLASCFGGGLLEFIFVFDHTRGTMLVVLSLSLIVFALDIPILFGFSVACRQDSGDTLVNAPSGYIKDDVLQFNQSFDSIASP
jgi:hypothetical protein